MAGMLREWRVRRAAGEAGLTLTVNPQLLEQEARLWPTQRRRLAIINRGRIPGFVKRVQLRVAFELSPFILDEGTFARQPVRGSAIYRRMADVHAHRHDLAASATFREIVDTIRQTGAYRHKDRVIRDAAQTEDFLRASYLDIIESMETDGYVIGKTSPQVSGGTGNAFVDRDGSILKAPGASHRLAAALLVGLDHGFPLRIIGLHRDFAQRSGISGNPGRVASAIRAVEARYAEMARSTPAGAAAGQ